jgi:hypothetical protein
MVLKEMESAEQDGEEWERVHLFFWVVLLAMI